MLSSAKYRQSKDKIYIHYTESSHGGEICAGQENNSWPSHEVIYYDISITGVTLEVNKDSWYHEEFPLYFECNEGDTVFIVVVQYGDGDTFGSSSGNKKVYEVFKTEKEASDYIEWLDKVEDKWDIVDQYGDSIYKCWTGYFNSFEGFEIVEAVVGKKNSDKYKKKRI